MIMSKSKCTPMNSACENRYDREKFARLVARLKGSRTAEMMSKDTGMSVSFLSKALSQNLPTRPSMRTLSRLSGADVNPQAQISYSELLESCGYDASEGDGCAEIEAERMDETKISPKVAAEFFATYCSSIPIARAPGIITNALIAKGVGPELEIRMKDTYFEIESKDKSFRCICVCGLCDYDSVANVMKIVIRSRLYDAIFSNKNVDNETSDKVIYVLTDNLRLFEYCKFELPALKCKSMIILYTENHVTISQEYEKVSAKSVAQESADFV